LRRDFSSDARSPPRTQAGGRSPNSTRPRLIVAARVSRSNAEGFPVDSLRDGSRGDVVSVHLKWEALALTSLRHCRVYVQHRGTAKLRSDQLPRTSSHFHSRTVHNWDLCITAIRSHLGSPLNLTASRAESARLTVRSAGDRVPSGGKWRIKPTKRREYL
jgi:hypothetical protein